MGLLTMINAPRARDVSTDILILSNGPGELTTWVYPFLRALDLSLKSDEKFNDKSTEGLAKLKPRISIALCPDQNASGQEPQLAQSFPNVDRVLPPEQFFDFLLWGKTPQWEWSKQGIVIFLGGDQFFTVVIAKRLGYKTLIYAEWEARWYRWVDGFAVRNQAIAAKIPAPLRAKASVIGDLMVDRGVEPPRSNADTALRICFMPGSKEQKLKIGVPLFVAIADILKQKRPDLDLVVPLAPTVTPETLAQYAQFSFPTPDSDGATAVLVEGNLVTAKGAVIKIHAGFPAHALISSSQLCITTVGANTAELASLNQPMLVLLPTNVSDIKVGWDGLLGLLASTPFWGKLIRTTINSILIDQIKKKGQLLAWPNIWAGKAIVPEIFGVITPTQIADEILFYLDHPEELAQMRDRLKEVCGESGAATKLVAMLLKML